MKIKNRITNGEFDSIFSTLYGDVDFAKQRYCKAVDAFNEIFGEREDYLLFSAPGRTEVGGNHTDHQHGCVLAGSVNLDVIAVVSLNNENVVRIKSEGYEMDTVSLDELEVNPKEEGKAIALIRGMLAEMKKAGHTVGGFDAYTTSNVLKGSGLSSSAAFEVLVGTIIKGAFNNDVDAVTIAKMAQVAENKYFLKPCGLMDQMASSVGGFTAIDFADVQNPVISSVDFDLSSHGFSLCIVNTGGNHADLTADYASVPQDCFMVAKALGKEYLREVDPNEFYKNIEYLRKTCKDKAVLRAFHFFNENERAVKEKEALQNNDFKEFLRLVNESGNYSYKYLQNVYSASNPNEQGLSLALALSEKVLNGEGAHRVHGGGFAGTIQAFVPNEKLEVYVETLEAVFGKDSCYVLNIRPVGGIQINKIK